MSKDASWKPLTPFGCEGPVGLSLEDVSSEKLIEQVLEHRLVRFRSVKKPSDDELLNFARSFSRHGYKGVLEWNGQKLFKLEVNSDSKNYIFSDEEVPLHWDGAFFDEPDFLVFYCDEATDSGGETLFADTRPVYEELRGQISFDRLELNIATEKVVHYGGERQLRVLEEHPKTGNPILRIAETVKTKKNPVRVTYSGAKHLSSSQVERLLIKSCYKESNLHVHRWRPGDLLVIDNHALVHGRRAFKGQTKRSIRRVQII